MKYFICLVTTCGNNSSDGNHSDRCTNNRCDIAQFYIRDRSAIVDHEICRRLLLTFIEHKIFAYSLIANWHFLLSICVKNVKPSTKWCSQLPQEAFFGVKAFNLGHCRPSTKLTFRNSPKAYLSRIFCTKLSRMFSFFDWCFQNACVRKYFQRKRQQFAWNIARGS